MSPLTLDLQTPTAPKSRNLRKLVLLVVLGVYPCVPRVLCGRGFSPAARYKPQKSYAAPLAVVIVSNPCPCGPNSRCRSRNENSTPKSPKTEKIHIPSRYPAGLLASAWPKLLAHPT